MLFSIAFIQLSSLTQCAAEGENVTFNCTVTGIGTRPFTVMWLNDANVLIDSINVTMNPVTFPLTLQNVTSKNYRNYTCVGRDDETMMNFVSASAILSGKLTQLIATAYNI